MIAPIPKKPVGAEAGAIYNQRVHEAVFGSAQVTQCQGGLVKKTTRGTSVIPQPQTVNRGGATPAAMYKLVDVRGDYFVCHSWDGTTEGSDPIYVAKEWKHRNSLLTEDYYGETHTYSYAPDGLDGSGLNVIRSDTDLGGTEQQIVIPPWSPGEVFNAIDAETGVTASEDDSSDITLLIIGRSAQWAAL